MSDRIGWGVRCQFCGKEMNGLHTVAECRRHREKADEREKRRATKEKAR